MMIECSPDEEPSAATEAATGWLRKRWLGWILDRYKVLRSTVCPRRSNDERAGSCEFDPFLKFPLSIPRVYAGQRSQDRTRRGIYILYPYLYASFKPTISQKL